MLSSSRIVLSPPWLHASFPIPSMNTTAGTPDAHNNSSSSSSSWPMIEMIDKKNRLLTYIPHLESLNHSKSFSLSPSSVSMFAGDRLSAILNSIQSGPFLSAAPSSSIFEQAAQPPSSSSLVHSPFVFGQSPSQLSQPQPQLLSKSVQLSDSAC